VLDLNQFYAWQSEKPSRTVKIEIEDKGEVKVWVYDYALGVGQFVASVGEIDLEGKAEEKEIKKYLELRAKYADEIREAS